MFNLMANSISIKNIGMKIYNYTNDESIMGRGPLMAGEYSKIVRLVLNFESKNKLQANESVSDKSLIKYDPNEMLYVDRIVHSVLTGQAF